jgi:hypothetical protein
VGLLHLFLTARTTSRARAKQPRFDRRVRPFDRQGSPVSVHTLPHPRCGAGPVASMCCACLGQSGRGLGGARMADAPCERGGGSGERSFRSGGRHVRRPTSAERHFDNSVRVRPCG